MQSETTKLDSKEITSKNFVISFDLKPKNFEMLSDTKKIFQESNDMKTHEILFLLTSKRLKCIDN